MLSLTATCLVLSALFAGAAYLQRATDRERLIAYRATLEGWQATVFDVSLEAFEQRHHLLTQASLWWLAGVGTVLAAQVVMRG